MAEGGHPQLIEVRPPKLTLLRVMQTRHHAKRTAFQVSLGVGQEEDNREAASLPERVAEASRLDRISTGGVVYPGEDLGAEEEGVLHRP